MVALPGALGSRAIDRAEERRVETLKANGYNAIRTSHNPVSQAFVAACDRLGVLLMEEAFDCWSVAPPESALRTLLTDFTRRSVGTWGRTRTTTTCTFGTTGGAT